MAKQPSTFTPSTFADAGALIDEIEQLRTSLESALEENGRLVDERERLLRRVTLLARALQAGNAQAKEPVDSHTAQAELKQSQTDEELRVTFEELQVLSEELEVANTCLHHANTELEARVGQRTRDLTDANAALRRSETRLNTLVEGMPQLVWRAIGAGQWIWASPQWTAFTGQSDADSRGDGWIAAFHPDDRDRVRAAWANSDAARGFDFEGRIRHAANGAYRHFRTRASAVPGANGTILEWLGTSTDVDDLVRLQHRQSVLVAELQHRTRNLMAVVQAVTVRTIRSSTSLEDFRARIDDRMQALSRAQALLSRRDAGGRVAFDTLLRDELSAHFELDASGNAAQLSTAGPSGIPLQSATLQTLALALHELATNAVKYGALAHPAGHLAVRWEIAMRGDQPRLLVDWRETGLPDPPKESAPDGYGRELIERALPYQLGADTRYMFTLDGVHCTIEVDVPQPHAALETADV